MNGPRAKQRRTHCLRQVSSAGLRPESRAGLWNASELCYVSLTQEREKLKAIPIRNEGCTGYFRWTVTLLGNPPTFLADVLHFFLYSGQCTHVDRCITVLNGQVNLIFLTEIIFHFLVAP